MTDYSSLSDAYKREAWRFVRSLLGVTRIKKSTQERIRNLRDAEEEDDVWELENLVGQHRRCSFCGNREIEGRVLFMGKISDKISICDECVRAIIGKIENGYEKTSEESDSGIKN